MKTAVMAALLLALCLCGTAIAQVVPDPCADCRDAAGIEKRKCDSAAKSPVEFDACTKRISEAMVACQVGACRPGTDAQKIALCPQCQSRASDEERSCRSMSPGSKEHIACAQRAGRMKAECEDKFCKLAAPR